MKPVPGDITTKYSKVHPALDYAASIGTSIKIPLGGIIESMAGVPTRYLGGNMTNKEHWAKYEDNPNGKHSGNVITVNHGDGVYTSYLHVSPYSASSMSGKKVRAGQIIGKTGHNGWSTGPHLHFEVWRNGVRIDPDKWLKSLKEQEMTSKRTAIWVTRVATGKWNVPESTWKNWVGLNDKQLGDRLENVWKAKWYQNRLKGFSGSLESVWEKVKSAFNK